MRQLKKGLLGFILKWRRKAVLFAADIIICLVTAYIAMLLRYAPDMIDAGFRVVSRNILIFVLPYMIASVLFGMYRVLWRYADAQQVFAQLLSCGVGGLVILLYNEVLHSGISRYMIIIQAMLVAVCVCSLRISARVMHERYTNSHNAQMGGGKEGRVLIVGAGMGGSYAAKLCRHNNAAHGKPVAMVDDSPLKQGMRVQGTPVVGAIADIPRVADALFITDIIIAIPSQKGERMREIVSLCNATKRRVMVLSDPMALPNDSPREDRLTLRRPNIADFLSRAEVNMDTRAVAAYIKDKTILVTGGGGSIGAEICRQLMAFSPRRLVVFDIYENCAYELERELKQKYGEQCSVLVLIGSIRDRERLREVMRDVKPDVVFHAAAHKHVPLMEDSPKEAIKNNVFGTLNVLETASEAGVARFVQISTDKAVNPTNVMGATKRITEMLTQAYARRVDMQCMAVRFGNVLGSHGSVIPLFESQILAGGPVTITHPQISRYFMTIPEAAQLVLQAGSNAATGCVYVLNMGEPVLIRELAEKLIRFYGLEPGKDIVIKYTGLRPGEKLHEELLMLGEREAMRTTQHDKIMVAPAIDMDEALFVQRLEALRDAVTSPQEVAGDGEVLDLLHAIVPTFTHSLLKSVG